MVKGILATCALLLLSGCALLTADEPLLIGADESGFAVREGLWAFRDRETCQIDPQRADPAQKSCLEWVRIQNNEGGAFTVDLLPPDAKGPFVVRVAPAGRDAFIGESVRGDEIVYLTIAPAERVWNPPFRRLYVRVIACEDVILDDAPPADIEVETDAKDGSITGCKVRSLGAAIEAAQRALRAHAEERAQAPIEFVRP